MSDIPGRELLELSHRTILDTVTLLPRRSNQKSESLLRLGASYAMNSRMIRVGDTYYSKMGLDFCNLSDIIVWLLGCGVQGVLYLYWVNTGLSAFLI
jgi:hypothetical protein